MDHHKELQDTARELKAIYASMRTCKECTSHLFHHEQSRACIHHLDDITARKVRNADALLRRKDIRHIGAELREFWNDYETQGEFHHAETIIDHPTPRKALRQYHLFDRYAVFIRQEGMMAELKKGEKVLFLGSGPFPLSAILLAELFNVHVTGVDVCGKCVRTSRKLVRKLRLQKNISIVKGDARKIPLSYDVIWVAALAQPKQGIIRHLSSAPPATRIIVRTSGGLRSLIYEQVDDRFFERFDKRAAWQATGKVKNSSVLLTPRKDYKSKTRTAHQ